ncbi:MAG: hypothetical protein O3C21_11040 [Verrucomicrobia bacterium]|nr:hypothetical protein [Verrucomicrobiota bacterium]
MDAIPTWGWAIGAALSYALLIWVQPMRELFRRGFQIVRRYRHLPVFAGIVFAAHALWLFYERGDPSTAVATAGKEGAGGLARLSEVGPFAVLGMVEGVHRPFLAFLPAAPISLLVLVGLTINLSGLLRELRDGIEALVRPKTGVWLLCLFSASGVLHAGHVFYLGGDSFWRGFLLEQGGAFFEGYVSVLGQSYVLLFAALGLVTLRRNLKKVEILKLAVRRSPRLWPVMLAYAVLVPSVREFLPSESVVRLVLSSLLALITAVFAFLQLDLLGEKRFSGWKRAVSHALDLQRRHFQWTVWFCLISMMHWLVFHLLTIWLISGFATGSILAAIAGTVFAFLEGAIAVWFLGVWAALYQEKLAH